MPFAVREIQSTPNPNAAKFVLDKTIAGQPISFLNAAAAAGHPLAIRLFQIEGISAVLLLGDFVTINKTPQAVWTDIKRQVKQVLAQASEV